MPMVYAPTALIPSIPVVALRAITISSRSATEYARPMVASLVIAAGAGVLPSLDYRNRTMKLGLAKPREIPKRFFLDQSARGISKSYTRAKGHMARSILLLSPANERGINRGMHGVARCHLVAHNGGYSGFDSHGKPIVALLIYGGSGNPSLQRNCRGILQAKTSHRAAIRASPMGSETAEKRHTYSI